MGGRGAYYAKIGEYSKPTELKEAVHFTGEQFGKKVGKHAQDFSLDASKESDRQEFARITADIIDNHTEIRIGTWRGKQGSCHFYIKGNDVVVVNSSNEYVTTLKNGLTNKRIQGA